MLFRLLGAISYLLKISYGIKTRLTCRAWRLHNSLAGVFFVEHCVDLCGQRRLRWHHDCRRAGQGRLQRRAQVR